VCFCYACYDRRSCCCCFHSIDSDVPKIQFFVNVFWQYAIISVWRTRPGKSRTKARARRLGLLIRTVSIYYHNNTALRSRGYEKPNRIGDKGPRLCKRFKPHRIRPYTKKRSNFCSRLDVVVRRPIAVFCFGAKPLVRNRLACCRPQ